MKKEFQAEKTAEKQGHRRKIYHDVSGNYRHFIHCMNIKSKSEDNRRYSQRIRRFQGPTVHNTSELGISQTAERFFKVLTYLGFCFRKRTFWIDY